MNIILIARFSRAAALAVGLFAAQGVVAQIDAQRYEAEKMAALATLMDQQLEVTERLAAVDNIGYASAGIGVVLLAIGGDRAEPDSIRLAALRKHRYEEDWLDLVFEIVADETENDELASGLVVDLSQRTTFRQPAEVRQRFQGVLRDRLDDPRDRTRLAAFRTLIASHDQQAIDKLVESVRGGGPLPVSPAEAVELLDTDGSVRHIVTLRPFLQHPDAETRAKAARALAVDPESRETIVEWVMDPQIAETVRLNGMRGLAREDEDFMAYAIELALSREESADIRYAALENSMRRLNYQGVDGKTQIAFANAVEQISGARGVVTSDGKDLGAEAKLLLAHLQKVFPVIRRHYARRLTVF